MLRKLGSRIECPSPWGGDDDAGRLAPEFHFEDLEVSERRMDVEDPVGLEEPVGGSPGEPATADVPTPVEEKCREGQDLAGMELDIADGNPADVSSLVFAAPVSDSPGVVGGQVEPVFAAPASLILRPGVIGGGCSWTHTEKCSKK